MLLLIVAHPVFTLWLLFIKILCKLKYSANVRYYWLLKKAVFPRNFGLAGKILAASARKSSYANVEKTGERWHSEVSTCMYVQKCHS